MDRRGIRFRKILIDIARYWYILIIFAALGALAGWRLTVSYNKNVDKQIAEAEELRIKTEEEEKALAEDVVQELHYSRKSCEEKMTKEAMGKVLDAYYWYKDKQSRRDYIATSLYMQMDPYDCQCLYLKFRVLHPEPADASVYRSYIHGLVLYVNQLEMEKELADKLKLEISPYTLSEMISISDSGEYDDILQMTVYQSELTEGLTDAIKEAFIGYGEKLAELYPGYHLELMGTSKASIINKELISAQESQRTAITDDQTRIDTAVKKFGNMQKAYYNMLVNGTEKETITVVVQEGSKKKSSAAAEEEELPSKRKVLMRVILGGAAGIVVFIILVFFANMLSGRLMSDLDFSRIYGLKRLGIIIERRKKGMAGFLQKAEYPDAEGPDEFPYLKPVIRRLLEKQENSEAVLVSSKELSDKAGLETVLGELKNEGIDLALMENFPGEKDAVEKLVSGKAVILVEEMHSSRLNKIDRIVYFCRENEIPVLGAVGIVGAK